MRLLLILSGVAALSTALALGLQDRVLSTDLERAAIGRADRAATAVEVLGATHLRATDERYRAISRTPALRATLEVDDAPTLRFYAETLRSREGADAVAFADREGTVTVAVGDAQLADVAAREVESTLIGSGGHAYTVVTVPLETSGVEIGRMVAVERIGEDMLAMWSELSGADVFLTSGAGDRTASVVRAPWPQRDLGLRVAVSMRDERIALANSRRNLLAAGGVALALAFGVSIGAARSLTRPIRSIQSAADRIGNGDFSTRIASARSDEIGDVARAVDDMGDRLADYRRTVEDQTRQLERGISDLQESQDRLASAQRLAQMGSWMLDYASGSLHGSDEFRALLGLSSDDKPIEPEWLLARIHADDREELQQAVTACIEGAAAMRIDVRLSRPGFAERVLHVQARVQEPDRQRGARLEGTIQDVTERRRAEDQIRYLHSYDPLTGLGNRNLFRELLEMELKRAKRSGARVGVFDLDIDRFARINETFGPSVGDQLLKDVADRLVQAIRSSDGSARSDPASAMSRLGGDEFTLILHGSEGGADFSVVARRLVDELSRPFIVSGHEVVVGASIGIAVHPDDGDDADELIQRAAAALSHAKEQGGRRVQFYASSMNEEALRRLVMETELRRAFDRDEFELHYQPKTCLLEACVTGAEALVRWRNADGELISPGLFVPIAEETGLITRLGDWVTRTACRQIADWHREGLELPVSVNLSVHQFAEIDLAASIRDILEETGAPPRLLELEITESTLMDDQADVAAALDSLRELGVRVSVDDFGTGYSSFAYLRRLPVDKLKIDRSFVMEIADDEGDAQLAAAIVSMGHALGLDVIAEGVETAEQRDLLARFGCDEMQGFLVSPAVPAEAFRAIVRQRGWTRRTQPESGDH